MNGGYGAVRHRRSHLADLLDTDVTGGVDSRQSRFLPLIYRDIAVL